MLEESSREKGSVNCKYKVHLQKTSTIYELYKEVHLCTSCISTFFRWPLVSRGRRKQVRYARMKMKES